MSANPKLLEQGDLVIDYDERGNDITRPGWVSTEITLRDLFLIFAPPKPSNWPTVYADPLEAQADWRRLYADRMLAERAKP